MKVRQDNDPIRDAITFTIEISGIEAASHKESEAEKMGKSIYKAGPTVSNLLFWLWQWQKSEEFNRAAEVVTKSSKTKSATAYKKALQGTYSNVTGGSSGTTLTEKMLIDMIKNI